jgi:hypothetical protein
MSDGLEAPEYRKRLNQYRETILELMKDELYRYERYNVEFAAMLVYSDAPLEEGNCCDAVRQSDRVHLVDTNLFLVVFDHVNAADGLKASQNYLYAYLNDNPHARVYAALVPIVQEETAIDMASRLFIVMEYALRKETANTVVDFDQMLI